MLPASCAGAELSGQARLFRHDYVAKTGQEHAYDGWDESSDVAEWDSEVNEKAGEKYRQAAPRP